MKNKLKIILGSNAIDRTEHAQSLIRKLNKQEREPQHLVYAKPLGISNHLALFPVRCDECNETFWAADPYASHALCKGPSRGVGFK